MMKEGIPNRSDNELQPGCVVRSLTADDIPIVVDLHVDAFAGYMNVALGRGYLSAFMKWYVGAPSAVALVGNMDRKVAGYVIGAPAGHSTALTRDLWPVGAWALAVRPYLLLQRRIRGSIIDRMSGLFGTPSQKREIKRCPTMELAGIAVDRAYRGRGVGDALLAAFEARARDAGMMEYSLCVRRDNSSARRFYEKNGMICSDTNNAVVSYTKDLPSQANLKA